MSALAQRVTYLGGRRFTVTRDRFGTYYVHNEPRGGATRRPVIIGGRVTYGYRFDCYRLADEAGSRVIFTHNPEGVTVAHADIGDGLPLCGWASDDDMFTADNDAVTCADCQVAL